MWEPGLCVHLCWRVQLRSALMVENVTFTVFLILRLRSLPSSVNLYCESIYNSVFMCSTEEKQSNEVELLNCVCLPPWQGETRLIWPNISILKCPKQFGCCRYVSKWKCHLIIPLSMFYICSLPVALWRFPATQETDTADNWRRQWPKLLCSNLTAH